MFVSKWYSYKLLVIKRNCCRHVRTSETLSELSPEELKTSTQKQHDNPPFCTNHGLMLKTLLLLSFFLFFFFFFVFVINFDQLPPDPSNLLRISVIQCSTCSQSGNVTFERVSPGESQGVTWCHGVSA